MLQENPDRTWELGARSEAIAAQLCAVLVAAVRAKYPPHEEVVAADDEIDVLPGQGVWLAKRGEGLGALSADKKRYFVLVYSQRSRALRMAYYADLQGRQPLDRKGAIPVSMLSSISARGVELRIVSGAPRSSAKHFSNMTSYPIPPLCYLTGICMLFKLNESFSII